MLRDSANTIRGVVVMKIIFRSLIVFSLCALWIVIDSGSELFSDTGSLQGLKLEVSLERNKGKAGEPIKVEGILTNIAKLVINGCLQGGDLDFYYSFTGPSWNGGGVTVDHPGCQENFSIEPGKVHKIMRTMQVPDNLRIGKYKIEISLDILDPATCGGFGCDKKTIQSSSETFFEVVSK